MRLNVFFDLTAIIISFPICFIIAGCALTEMAALDRSKLSSEDCLEQLTMQIEKAAASDFILTLDGQRVLLEEFFLACDRHGAPECALFKKFYRWQSDVKTTSSRSSHGIVTHKIRVYFNPSSICYPERVNPLRIYGDVAEFYDEHGEFMGLSVYMGDGLYFPLKFSGYSKRNRIFPFNDPRRI